MQPDEQKTAAPESAQTSPKPQPSPVAAQTADSPGRKKMNKNVVIGIVVAAVVLAAAAAWGVYALLASSPDNLMKAAVQNLSKEKAMAATIKITDGTTDGGTTLTGDAAFSIDTANDKNMQVVFGLGDGDKRFGLNALSLDGTAYAKVTQAQNLAPYLAAMGESTDTSATMFAGMLENINDQWFELKSDELQSFMGGETTAKAVTASPQDVKKMLEIYDRHPFVKADKTLADETIDGIYTAHFSIRFDKNTYISYMQAVKDANLATIKVTDQDIETAKQQSELTSDATIELWIARDSKKFKQLRVTSTKQGEEGVVTVTVNNTLPAFEKFEKPANPKSITELMTIILGGSTTLQSADSSELLLTQ